MVKLFLKNSNLCDHNSPTSQTDRQTDRQTTCDCPSYSGSKRVHLQRCNQTAVDTDLRLAFATVESRYYRERRYFSRYVPWDQIVGTAQHYRNPHYSSQNEAELVDCPAAHSCSVAPERAAVCTPLSPVGRAGRVFCVECFCCS